MVKASNEVCFGFQVATKTITDGVAVSKLAAEAGASWLDINCGCPIYGESDLHLQSDPEYACVAEGLCMQHFLPVVLPCSTEAGFLKFVEGFSGLAVVCCNDAYISSTVKFAAEAFVPAAEHQHPQYAES